MGGTYGCRTCDGPGRTQQQGSREGVWEYDTGGGLLGQERAEAGGWVGRHGTGLSRPGWWWPGSAETGEVNPTETTVPRHAWLNTLVGMLDSTFVLTEEELFFCQQIVRQLLDALHIPERGAPENVPTPLAAELTTSFWSVQLHAPGRDNPVLRNPRTTRPGDTVVTIEAWRNTLVGMLLAAYPDLDPTEYLAATQVFDDLLVALGVPSRAARFVPEDVVRAHLEVEGL
jgi:hypothetical protein